jgi:hypothetical protein
MQSKEKEYVSQYNKLYQAKNKESLQAKRMVKDKCSICGKMISHSYISKHMKTSICQKNKQN